MATPHDSAGTPAPVESDSGVPLPQTEPPALRASVTPLGARPRHLPRDEAYLRSEMERAAMDIAAGW